MKEGVVSCCIQRVWTVTQDVNIVTEEDNLKGVLQGNKYRSDVFVKTANKPSTVVDLTEEPTAMGIHSFCGRNEWGCETGMKMIQYQDCILISIHISWAVDVS